jgi:hypothetical protein
MQSSVVVRAALGLDFTGIIQIDLLRAPGHRDGATPGHKYNETCSRRLRRLHVRIAHGIDDARFRRHAHRSVLRQSYRPSFNGAPPTVSLYCRSTVTDHASRYLDFVEGGWLSLPYWQNEMLPLNGLASGRAESQLSRKKAGH